MNWKYACWTSDIGHQTLDIRHRTRKWFYILSNAAIHSIGQTKSLINVRWSHSVRINNGCRWLNCEKTMMMYRVKCTQFTCLRSWRNLLIWTWPHLSAYWRGKQHRLIINYIVRHDTIKDRVKPCPKTRRLKPCPHCRRKVWLSQKTARQRRQLPNSATVALFCDSVDRA